MSRKRREEDIDDSSEEAREEHERIEQSAEVPIAQDEAEEEARAQDLDANEQQDYEQIDELDRYEDEGVDNEDISDDPEARMRAEEQLNRRRREDRQHEDEMDDLMSENQRFMEERMRRRDQEIFLGDEDEEQIDEMRYIDPEEAKGKLIQWIKEPQTLKYIKNKFSKFLTHYKGDQNYAIYANKMREMAIHNQMSFEVSYMDLKAALATVAMWTGMHPEIMLPILNDIAYILTCKNFPTYRSLVPETYVKIVQLPFIDQIRDLRFTHLGHLIKIRGVITIRTEVLNQMKKAYYKCQRCGEVKGPFTISDKQDVKLGVCNSCQSNGPYLIEKQRIIYRNFQRMTIQQSPSDVLPGRIPRNKEVIVYGDNVDQARPGDEVEIIGIFMQKYDCNINVKQGFPLFSTYIEVNHIVRCADSESTGKDSYQEHEFRKLAKEPALAKKIYGSIAPSIYGHEGVKRALTLAMFGGEPVEGTHRVRGDINVLLLGDPGIAKSQFLKSIQKVFHRCIYTTGKGASAVGLTASVKRDFQTNEWKLEAGALVLADKGICLIDQFDKMNQHDRTSIHEAMQQQSISISKAGIVTSLRARCSVIAAANPVQGRYNSSMSFSDNVDLSDPILSRFDILNVIKDDIDQQIDYKLSTFVINSHIKNHPYTQKYKIDEEKLPQLNDEESVLPFIEHAKLKQYIKFAREKCHPQLAEKNLDLINKFFQELRQASKNFSGMHVSVRQIESIIRISKAHAKMHLRSEVEKQDIDVGIEVLLESFIQTQKVSTARDLRKKFFKYLLHK